MPRRRGIGREFGVQEAGRNACVAFGIMMMMMMMMVTIMWWQLEWAFPVVLTKCASFVGAACCCFYDSRCLARE